MHYFLKYLLFTFAITLSVNCFAVKKYDGTIYYENETVSVKFYIPIRALEGTINFPKIQYQIKYWDAENKLKTLTAGEAIEYRFNYENEVIRMISYTYATEDQSKLGAYTYSYFVKLEFEEKLTVYSQESQSTIPIPLFFKGSFLAIFGFDIAGNKVFFFEKNNGPITRIEKKKFKKHFSEYFSDCKDLALKIEQKLLTHKNALEIAEYYNNNCN